MRTPATSGHHRLKATVVIAIVSLPIALPLIAYANHTLRLQAATDGNDPETGPDKKEPGSGKENEARVEEMSPALHVNELHTSKAGISVKFVEVNNDSRCPTDVRCIWAGNASVTLELSKKDVEPLTVKLNTYIEPREVVYASKRIALGAVTPYPNSKKAIEKKDYAITLRFLPVVTTDKKSPDTPNEATKPDA